MPTEAMGPAQIAALLVLLQRGIEEIHSQRNTRRLLAEGAVEAGREYYPVVAVTHLAWIASIFLLIPRGATAIWPLLIAYLVLQVARYWVIGTLGRYWTHHIITLKAAPIMKAGPYSLVRHPNYVVVFIESFLLPFAFGAVALGVIMAAVTGVVLYYKVLLEDAALAARRAAA
jgi:methyltransferase